MDLAILAGCFGLIGVVLGCVLNFTFDRAKFNRENKLRKLAKREDLFIEILTEANKCSELEDIALAKSFFNKYSAHICLFGSDSTKKKFVNLSGRIENLCREDPIEQLEYAAAWHELFSAMRTDLGYPE